MPENKPAISTDLNKLDAHEIQPEEYEDIPELTDEWLDKAEFAVGEKMVRPARRPGRPKSESAKKLIALRSTRISSSGSAPRDPAGNRGSTPRCANTSTN